MRKNKDFLEEYPPMALDQAWRLAADGKQVREEMVIILTEAEDQSCAINGRIQIGSNRHANAYCGKTDGGVLLTLIRQNPLQIILGSKIRSNNFIG